jgi:hypothetical protein
MVDIDPELLALLTDAELAQFDKLIAPVRKLWTPHPANKPQQEAYVSPANVLGYGGAAGGGKSALGCGLACTEHLKTGIFRQNGTELSALVDYLAEIMGSREGLSEQKGIWRFVRPDGVPAQIELGAFPRPGDERKYQGRPHDLLVFDEAQNMRQSAVRYIMGWLRSTVEGQRCRVVFTFNPPTDAIGQWIIQFFAPWLDSSHRNPAKPGELRWFTTIDGVDAEVEDPAPFEHDGRIITPRSRTFIPSRVSDNPYLAGTEYEAELQAMPEPWRSQMLFGDFEAGMEDDPWQVIPTAWVEAAMARWKEPEKREEMWSMGVDVAMGGRDQTIIARRHGMWFDKPIVYPGKDCLDGATVAGFCIAALRDGAVIHIDLFGVGAKPYGVLERHGLQVVGVNVGDVADGLDVNGRLRFKNLRSLLWWRMREALDPSSNTGICLPPDPRLKADLTAPTWKPVGPVIQVMSSEDIQKLIGRSPDYGSAYVLALMDTPKMSMIEAVHRHKTEQMDFEPFR